MEPVNFHVGEDDYQLIPHTGFSAINLDRKVTGLIGRFIDGTSDVINAASAFSLLAGVFESYSDSDFKWIVEETLKNVTVTTAGKKSVRLSDMDQISIHFAKQYPNLYAVLFEVWRLEEFSPFAMAPQTEQSGS